MSHVWGNPNQCYKGCSHVMIWCTLETKVLTMCYNLNHWYEGYSHAIIWCTGETMCHQCKFKSVCEGYNHAITPFHDSECINSCTKLWCITFDFTSLKLIHPIFSYIRTLYEPMDLHIHIPWIWRSDFSCRHTVIVFIYLTQSRVTYFHKYLEHFKVIRKVFRFAQRYIIGKLELYRKIVKHLSQGIWVCISPFGKMYFWNWFFIHLGM